MTNKVNKTLIEGETLQCCPFCGSIDLALLRGQIVGTRPDSGCRMIQCQNCRVTGPYTFLKDAIKHWNNRNRTKVRGA